MSECSVAQSCLTLCNPMDCNPSGSSAHGIFQARILEQIATSCSRKSQPRDRTWVSWGFCLSNGFFTTRPPVIFLLISQPKGLIMTTNSPDSQAGLSYSRKKNILFPYLITSENIILSILLLKALFNLINNLLSTWLCSPEWYRADFQ